MQVGVENQRGCSCSKRVPRAGRSPDSPMSIQSLTTPAMFMVSAEVLPMSRNTAMLRPGAHGGVVGWERGGSGWVGGWGRWAGQQGAPRMTGACRVEPSATQSRAHTHTTLTKRRHRISQEHERVNHDTCVVGQLVRLQEGKREQQKTKAARRDIIERGDGVELEPTRLRRAGGWCKEGH